MAAPCSIPAVLIPVLVMLVACGPRASPASTPEPTATAVPTSVPAASVFEELLGVIPDTPETRASVYINDFLRIWERAGLPPLKDTPEGLVREHLERALPGALGAQAQPRIARGPSPYISGWESQLLLGFPGRRDNLGFDYRDVEQTALAGLHPRQLEIVRGHYDPQATQRALSACSGECIPPDAREEYQSIPFYRWGEDFKGNLQHRLKPPAFDSRGRAGRLAVQDKYVFRTLWTEGMKALIDASLGQRPSLADVEEFRLLAKGLSELGAHAVYLSNNTQWVSDLDSYVVTLNERRVPLDSPLQEVQRIRQEVQQALLRPYQAVGTGSGQAPEGGYIALVLVHSDEPAAKENVGLLRQRVEGTPHLSYAKPWREIVDGEGMEIRTEGRVLLAKLPLRGEEFAGAWAAIARPAAPEIAVFPFPSPDPLLLHE
jgi:hypothetical protein